MKLTNEEKCTYCREYGNMPCEECNKKLEAKKAMSKTKFTKVAVSESAQFEDNKSYYFITGWGEIVKDVFISAVDFTEYSYRYKYFLEESPDREEEMIQMLELALNRLENTTEYDVLDFFKEDCRKIKSLLQSLKQEK